MGLINGGPGGEIFRETRVCKSLQRVERDSVSACGPLNGPAATRNRNSEPAPHGPLCYQRNPQKTGMGILNYF